MYGVAIKSSFYSQLSVDPISHKILAHRKALIIMATKLFIGKLSYNTTDDTLRALFEKYGTVSSAQFIKDRDSGQSKGFAFVEMDDQEAAQKAINELDGKEFEGRMIIVNVARPKEDRPSGGSNFRSGFQRR